MEAMTLKDVRTWASNQAVFDDVTEREKKAAIGAIDAHLAQPAQAVDVDEIRAVADMLNGYCEASDDCCYGTLSTSLVRDLTKRITAALPNANGKESPDAAR